MREISNTHHTTRSNECRVDMFRANITRSLILNRNKYGSLGSTTINSIRHKDLCVVCISTRIGNHIETGCVATCGDIQALGGSPHIGEIRNESGIHCVHSHQVDSTNGRTIRRLQTKFRHRDNLHIRSRLDIEFHRIRRHCTTVCIADGHVDMISRVTSARNNKCSHIGSIIEIDVSRSAGPCE